MSRLLLNVLGFVLVTLGAILFVVITFAAIPFFILGFVFKVAETGFWLGTKSFQEFVRWARP